MKGAEFRALYSFPECTKILRWHFVLQTHTLIKHDFPLFFSVLADCVHFLLKRSCM